MPLKWNLKKWLAVERDIYRPSELQALLAEKAGVQLSLQAVSALINGRPDALRVQTIQALCNALNCKLSDFCEVWPDSESEQQKQRRVAGGTPVRLYGAKEQAKNQESIFPDPHQYTETRKGKPGKGQKSQEGSMDHVSHPQAHYVYMVCCANGAFYTGYTINVERRIALHNAGKGGRYTRSHRPVSLVATWTFNSKGEALRAERELKRLPHERKRALAESAASLEGEVR